MQWTTAHVFIGCWSLFDFGSVTLNEGHDIGVASDVVELFFAESSHFGIPMPKFGEISKVTEL